METELGLNKKICSMPISTMFRTGQVLIRKCATRSSVEANDNSIMTSQWKYIVTSLVACLPKHVLLMYGCHVGDEGKQLNWSYVGNHKGTGGEICPYH